MKKLLDLKLDPTFKPAYLEYKEFQKAVLESKKPEFLTLSILRDRGHNELFSMLLFSDPSKFGENLFYVERIVKSMLWIYGGYKINVVGPVYVYDYLVNEYQQGKRTFDLHFMEKVYDQKFEFTYNAPIKAHKKQEHQIGKNLMGYRIGFDAGGSDMKVSAVVDGETIFSEEIVWHPKLNSDPEYHKRHIREAILKAKEKMPWVDAIGVSSAGIYINNETRAASLFIQVPEDLFDQHVRRIYLDIAEELGVPIEVANDGDVTALAGSMSLGKNNLLGIAMGTSQAAGYINNNGNITGWLNELAFVPIDFQSDAPVDEWSGDLGCGVKYLSQDAVIRLAESAHITFPEGLSLAQKLAYVQSLDEQSEVYQDIYKTIGTYLGYAIAYYTYFYHIEYVLLLGRVTSGLGGTIILNKAQEVLHVNKIDISLTLPDEKVRRVGQSVAAASLVKL